MANMGEDGMKKFSELLAGGDRDQPAQPVRVQSVHELSSGRMDQGRPGFLEAQGACCGSTQEKLEEKPAQ